MMALIMIRLPQLPNGRDDTLSKSTHSVLSPREAHTLTQLTRAWFPIIQGLISDTENSSFTKNNLELDSDVLNSHKHDSGSRRNILTDSMFSTPQVNSHRESSKKIVELLTWQKGALAGAAAELHYRKAVLI